MKCFHVLMRMGHAINAISEFTRTLKKYLKDKGCAAILTYIKQTLVNPWLSEKWYEAQRDVTPQLRFQLQ